MVSRRRVSKPRRTAGRLSSRHSSRQALGRRRSKADKSLTPLQERDAQLWNDAVGWILSEAKAGNPRSGSPYDRPMAVLERELYRLVMFLLNRKHGIWIIESGFLATGRQLPRSGSVRERPFDWALKAVADLPQLEPLKLGRHGISRMAREMEYAQQHQIDPDLFSGFIMQTGRGRIYSVAPGAVEPWKARKNAGSRPAFELVFDE